MFAAFNLLLAFWVILQPAGPRVSPIVSNLAGFAGPLLALPLCFGGLRGRRTSGSSGTIAWRWTPVLLGMGILSYVLGRIVFTYYIWALDQLPPMPSYATIGFLGQYPFLLLGILLLLPGRTASGASRTRVALDGLMIMTAAVTFSWYLFLGPVVRQGTETLLAKVMATTYPLADIVLIASLLVLVLRRGQHALRPAMRLLTAGLILIVLTDVLYGYERIHEVYVTGTILDVGWPVGYMLVGLGGYLIRLAPDSSTDGADQATAVEGSACGTHCCRTHSCRPWPSSPSTRGGHPLKTILRMGCTPGAGCWSSWCCCARF